MSKNFPKVYDQDKRCQTWRCVIKLHMESMATFLESITTTSALTTVNIQLKPFLLVNYLALDCILFYHFVLMCLQTHSRPLLFIDLPQIHQFLVNSLQTHVSVALPYSRLMYSQKKTLGPHWQLKQKSIHILRKNFSHSEVQCIGSIAQCGH